MEAAKDRCVVLPVETDAYYSVRGLIRKRYVRVQAGKNDFYIPANLFRKAAFTLREGERLHEAPVNVERLTRVNGDGLRLSFTVKTRSGELRTAVIAGDVIEEILERIDQVKALLHSYYDEGATALSDEDEPVRRTPDPH